MDSLYTAHVLSEIVNNVEHT